MERDSSAMGGYQLSLQAGPYNPAARLDAKPKKSGSSGSIGSADSGSSWNGSVSRGKKSKRTESPKEMLGFGLLQTKRVASQQNLEELTAQQASPPRHSTACCDGLSLRRETERRLSSQRTKVSTPLQMDESGHSFRSDDSDNLALWEEKESTSTATSDQGWMKQLTVTQSPRWLDAVRKFDATKLTPWRSSPVHPKSGDTPRVSLDRKPSTRSLHGSTKAWYNKKIRNGESRSVRTPSVGPKLVRRQSGELSPALVANSSKWDHDAVTSDDGSKHGSFSRMMEEDTRFTASAVAWDISPRPEPVVEKAQPGSGALSWEIPAEATAMAENENPLVTIDTQDVTESSTHKSVDLSHTVKECGDSTRSEAFFDGHSEYASCRTFVEDELSENDSREDAKSATDEAVGFVNVIDFVAPLLTKLQSIEKGGHSPALTQTKSSERRVSFKWEAPPGQQQLRAEEVAPTTETPEPLPCATRDGSSTPYETLRQQYIMKSKSAPLDGLYVFLPQGGSAKLPLPWEKKSSTVVDAPDSSVLTKSKSYSGDYSALRRVNSSRDHRLFTKLRKSVFGTTTTPGPSPLGVKNDFGDYIELSSPRSILRGPDDGSVPSSSNPSLRSDPGMPVFSARPNSASQSMSSCNASFDLNEGDYERISSSYNLNSTAACIVVESRRVSLSFRDFGPAQPSDEGMAVNDEASENATSNVELLGCDGELDADAFRSLSETMQSPELWTATFSTRYHDSPARSDMPGSPCAAAMERELPEFVASTELLSSPAPPLRQLAYLMSCEDEQEQPPIAHMQKSRSARNGEFAARLGVMFSPLRLISSHESSNHGCFVAAATISPPHDVVEGEGRSPNFAATLEFLSPVDLRSSSMKARKSKGSWTNVEMVKSRSSKRRHSSEDPQTVMVTLSKAMKKILSKCTVKRSTSKGKSKMDSPALAALPPPEFHFT